jgi:hypothetical protein
VKKTEIDFVYPEGGLYKAWVEVARAIEGLGGTIHTGVGAELTLDPEDVANRRGPRRRQIYEPSEVIWTAPITLACKQLGCPSPTSTTSGSCSST